MTIKLSQLMIVYNSDSKINGLYSCHGRIKLQQI